MANGPPITVITWLHYAMLHMMHLMHSPRPITITNRDKTDLCGHLYPVCTLWGTLGHSLYPPLLNSIDCKIKLNIDCCQYNINMKTWNTMWITPLNSTDEYLLWLSEDRKKNPATLTTTRRDLYPHADWLAIRRGGSLSARRLAGIQ